jgi:ABC-type dipeptide/oligopeptide/nickel transport system ATPase component
LPPGCTFRPRCFLATPRCARDVPPLRRAGEHQQTACFEYERLREKVPA